MKPLSRIDRTIAALASLGVTLVLLLGVVSLSVPPERVAATQLAKAGAASEAQPVAR